MAGINKNNSILRALAGLANYFVQPAYAEQLSPSFSREEFNQKNNPLPIEDVVVDPRLIAKLELLRSRINRPIIINSGYRSPNYNAKIGGAKNSQHKYGRAADIRVPGLTPKQVNQIAQETGFGYVEPSNLTPTWTHVDVTPRGKNLESAPIQNIPYRKKEKK